MWTMGVYDQVKKAFQDIIAPELHAIRGDIRVLDERISGLKTELLAEIRRGGPRHGGDASGGREPRQYMGQDASRLAPCPPI